MRSWCYSHRQSQSRCSPTYLQKAWPARRQAELWQSDLTDFNRRNLGPLCRRSRGTTVSNARCFGREFRGIRASDVGILPTKSTAKAQRGQITTVTAISTGGARGTTLGSKSDQLFRNNNDGSFTDVTVIAARRTLLGEVAVRRG